MTVYFDSTVFMAILNGEATAKKIRDLLADLQSQKIRIYTSIVTVQEASVDTFRIGTTAKDSHSYIRKLARIEGITRDVAMTAAKLEAQIIDAYKGDKEKAADNKRRKWDCFHIASAMDIGCARLYSLSRNRERFSN